MDQINGTVHVRRLIIKFQNETNEIPLKKNQMLNELVTESKETVANFSVRSRKVSTLEKINLRACSLC